jgi:hypothetical protein
VAALLCQVSTASTNIAIDDAVRGWAKTGITPSFTYALVDLNDDGILDAVVLINDHAYCGSGGCNMLVLVGDSGGFKVLSSSTIIREPISVLPERRFKWHTLAVHIAGGGAKPGVALLRFDGKRYRGNPTMARGASTKNLVGATTLTLVP